MSAYILYPTYVQRNSDGASIPLDGSNRDYNEYLAWVAEGNTPDAPPPPSFAEYYATFLSAFSAWMDAVAAQNQYDSLLSCASYATSSIQQYADDAKAIIAWRDALWTWAAAWQAGFNGQLPATIPTWEEVQAQAPQPAAYGWVVHDPGTLAGSDIGSMPFPG